MTKSEQNWLLSSIREKNAKLTKAKQDEFNGLKWLKVDPNNLPSGVVLAIDKGGTYIFGRYFKTAQKGIICIDNGGEFLKDATHYIPISDLLKIPKE